jgi:hypothetical protein
MEGMTTMRPTRKPFMRKLVKLLPMRVLRVQENDILVLQTDLMLDREQIRYLREAANEQFGTQFGKIAILTAGIKPGVLRKVERTDRRAPVRRKK